MTPSIPGVVIPPVTLGACPAEATRCANIETVAEVPIPGQSAIKTTQKLGQCANETLCGSTQICDMTKQSVPGFQSCKVSVTVFSEQKCERFCYKFFYIKRVNNPVDTGRKLNVHNKIRTTSSVFIATLKRYLPIENSEKHGTENSWCSA